VKETESKDDLGDVEADLILRLETTSIAGEVLKKFAAGLCEKRRVSISAEGEDG
jgi:hypothetical protein